MGVSAADASVLYHPHNYYNHPPSNAWKSTIADTVLLFFALAIVILRCYTKLRITRTRGWEDYTILGALVCYIVFCSMDYTQTYRYGAGRHTWDLPPQWWNGYLRTGAVGTYTYVLGTMLAKMSLLLFIYHIFKVDFKFRVASWFVGFFLIVWSTVTLLLIIFSCHPIKANWDVVLYLKPSTHCSPRAYDVANIHGYCNIFSDAMLLILPIPVLWTLQMSIGKKLSIAAVFATGSFICGVAIVRQYITYHTPKASDNWDVTRQKVWMSVEFGLSIIVACLPPLSPFFKRYNILASLLPASLRSRFSSQSRKQGGRWPLQNSPARSDIERGTSRQELKSDERKTHASWQTPRTWKQSEKHNHDDFHRISQESESTLHPVLPTHRELEAAD